MYHYSKLNPYYNPRFERITVNNLLDYSDQNQDEDWGRSRRRKIKKPVNMIDVKTNSDSVQAINIEIKIQEVSPPTRQPLIVEDQNIVLQCDNSKQTKLTMQKIELQTLKTTPLLNRVYPRSTQNIKVDKIRSESVHQDNIGRQHFSEKINRSISFKKTRENITASLNHAIIINPPELQSPSDFAPFRNIRNQKVMSLKLNLRKVQTRSTLNKSDDRFQGETQKRGEDDALEIIYNGVSRKNSPLNRSQIKQMDTTKLLHKLITQEISHQTNKIKDLNLLQYKTPAQNILMRCQNYVIRQNMASTRSIVNKNISRLGSTTEKRPQRLYDFQTKPS